MNGSTDYAIVRKAALFGQNILLMSDAGAGKNHLAEALSADLKCPLTCLSLNSDVTNDEIVGSLSLRGFKHGTVWNDGYWTAFFRLATTGKRCIVVLDEINAVSHGIGFRFHACLDERRALTLIEKPGRETLVDEQKKLIVIATMNPDYRGTKPLNQALQRRFKVKLTLDYNEVVERKLLTARGIKGIQLDRLIALAHRLRKSYHDTDLNQPFGTADMLNYAENVRLHGEAVARHVLLQNYDADERPPVREAITIHLDNAATTSAAAQGVL
jgi:MoxR-like ATPase